MEDIFNFHYSASNVENHEQKDAYLITLPYLTSSLSPHQSVVARWTFVVHVPHRRRGRRLRVRRLGDAVRIFGEAAS